MGKSGGKGISYFGLVAMGIGCMLGTSWLLLTGTWLETAGGPLNLVVAFALCIIIELPFAFAYMEAIPMLPLPGGEVVYSVSANLTAARLAVALKAEKLIHLVESTKLLRDPAAPEAPIPELELSQVPAMIRSGVIPPEMALKANCSVEAVRSGVRSATLLDGSVPHAILLELLSDEGIGTMLTH